MHRRLHFFGLMLALSWSCGLEEESLQPEDSQVEESSESPFDAPQGVVFTPEWVVVSNTAYQPMTQDFGTGSLTLISRSTRDVIRQIPVSAPNPQKLLVVGDSLYVLCTGQTRFDSDTWLNIAVGPGALDRFPLADLAEATGPAQSLVLPLGAEDPREGGFGSMVVTEDEQTLVLASGLKALLWAVDLPSMTWKRGPDNPLIPYEHESNDTLTVTRGMPGEIVVSSFNKDAIYVLDASALTWKSETPISLGSTADLEGLLQSLLLPTGDLLGLLTIANGLYQVPQDGSSGFTLAPVGPIANHMALRENFVFVVNSGVNNLVRVDWEDGTTTSPFAVFPVGSNPWEMAIEPGGQLAVVTLNLSHQIAWVDLETGEQVELTP